MHLIISDQGNLGTALAAECQKEGVPCEWYAKEVMPYSRDIGVYVGRGRRFAEFLDFCIRHNLPILQCSSDIDIAMYPQIWTPVFDVSNAAASVMLFLKQLEELAASLKRRKIEVDWVLTESHQASKVSPPGTALKIADILGIPRNKIQSIRRRPEFHSHHGLQGYVQGSAETLEYCCRVEGLEPYARGIIRLARDLDKEVDENGKRRNGVYKATDIRSS